MIILDRVTQVLDSFKEESLIDWKIKVGKKEARRISTLALKLGTKVHAYIEEELKGGSPKGAKKEEFEFASCVEAWNKFRARHQVTPLVLEQELVNQEYQVIGHRDFKGMVDEKLVTLDYKTSSQLNLKNWIQVNVYNWMDAEPANYVGLVRLDKHIGIFDYQVKKYDRDLVTLFLAMLKVHREFYCANGAEENTNGTECETSSSPTENTI